MKQKVFRLFSVVVIIAMVFGFVPLQAQAAVPGSLNIVISQVYGGGGNSGATYKNDFIELYNLSTTAVDITGWTVQYASSAGSTWQKTELSGTIGPGKYYLIQEAQGSGGTVDLPTPNAIGTIAMSGTAGKVALSSSDTTLSGSCPSGLVDLVGFGLATNCSETSPTPNLSNTTAALRNGNGATDTDNNLADFTIGAPNPRNTPPPESAPSVKSTSPVSLASNVGATTNLTVTFSEPVDVVGDWFTLSCSESGTHTALTSGGPSAFTLDPETDFSANDVCTLTVLASQVSDQDTDDSEFDLMLADYSTVFTTGSACLLPTTPLYSIQGSGLNSPLVNATVLTRGVVTGDFEGTVGLKGFFIQDASGDGDATTSDGIFVYKNNTTDTVSIGDEVVVSGKVAEYKGLTEITSPVITTCGTGSIAPIMIDLPAESLTEFEAYEGMLVTHPQDLIISEYFNFDQYGEIVLTSERHMTPTAVYEPGSVEYANAVQAYLLDKITLDDGSSVSNPEFSRHPNGESFTLDNLFRGGDKVANVTGVVDQFDNNYRIQPTEGADYTSENPRPAEPEDVGGTLKVVSMNTLNYFTTLDLGPDICGPLADQECRGADSQAEFDRQHAKLVAAILEMDPDVIGLIEVENNATDAPMEILVEGLNTALGADVYAYVATGAIGSDAIRAALIYKPATVSMLGDFAILDSTVDARFLDDFNRPVLAQTFVENQSGGIFTVAVNHLKSKGSACAGDPDLGDGAGNCDNVREEAAKAEVDWLATDPTGSGDPDFLIIGDLNSYDKEDPIDAIKAGPDDILGTADDYYDLVFEFQGEDAYSYVFDGQMGYLDFAISGAMVSQVTGTDVWHVNADEPDLIDYDMSYKKDAQDLLYAADPFRYSDHDPVIIGLDLVYFEAAGPYSVVENGTTTLTVPARKMDLNEGALTYAWDLDGDGVFETPGRTVTFDATGLTAPQSVVVKVKATNWLGYSTIDAVIVNVIYDFKGFLGQVDNQPVLNIAIAGNVIPVKFSLKGNKGLDIFAAGTPTVEKVYCPITATKNVVEKYVTVTDPLLSYNATKDKYKFTWQTDAAWAGTCQLFTIELNDGTTHTALFKFK